MEKKFLVVATLLTIISFFTFSYVFAATNNNTGSNVVNGVRDFVGGAENVIEDAGKGVANGIRSGINGIEGTANNMSNDVQNSNNNGQNNNSNDQNAMNQNDTVGAIGTMDTNGNNGGYTATRTSAEGGMFSNISDTVWTWTILAIVGVIIVALVLYYAKQNNNVTTYHHNDDDDNE